MLGDIRESFGEEPEWAEDQEEEYLDRIGVEEDIPEAEDGEILYAEGINPINMTANTEIWGARTIHRRHGGARLTNINANTISAENLNGNTLSIQNNFTGDVAEFSATEINHPQIADHTERLDTLERRYNTLVELAEKQSELIQALIGKLGI